MTTYIKTVGDLRRALDYWPDEASLRFVHGTDGQRQMQAVRLLDAGSQCDIELARDYPNPAVIPDK